MTKDAYRTLSPKAHSPLRNVWAHWVMPQTNTSECLKGPNYVLLPILLHSGKSNTVHMSHMETPKFRDPPSQDAVTRVRICCLICLQDWHFMKALHMDLYGLTMSDLSDMTCIAKIGTPKRKPCSLLWHGNRTWKPQNKSQKRLLL